jgi:hypothetical protein
MTKQELTKRIYMILDLYNTMQKDKQDTSDAIVHYLELSNALVPFDDSKSPSVVEVNNKQNGN